MCPGSSITSPYSWRVRPAGHVPRRALPRCCTRCRSSPSAPWTRRTDACSDPQAPRLGRGTHGPSHRRVHARSCCLPVRYPAQGTNGEEVPACLPDSPHQHAVSALLRVFIGAPDGPEIRQAQFRLVGNLCTIGLKGFGGQPRHGGAEPVRRPLMLGQPIVAVGLARRTTSRIVPRSRPRQMGPY